VLGVRVDCVDMAAALARIEAMVDDGGHHLVATVNPEFVMRAQQDPAFARVLESADLCLPDGSGVLWAARRQGCEVRTRVTGTDLVEPLAGLCARRSFGLFLLGAPPGVADVLAQRLMDRHPGLKVAAHSGSPEPMSDAETLERIRAAGAKVLLVAYGAPSQELWIDRLKEQLGVSVSMGVGGAFDYLSGRVRRAPLWVRGAGAEWAYRLGRQPWRLRRMSVLPVFAWRVLRSRR
jgi:N-acetylglucosaminyldiphosphoundecaprenol N-acetyl-beta-D-mannosaminyltransferase